MYVPVKTLPDSIRAALRSVGYGGKDIDVEVSETFQAPGSYGAGHRGRVLVVELATGRTQYAQGSYGGDNPFSTSPVDSYEKSPLPPGFAALTSGHQKIWHLHLNPANAAAWLPGPPEVSPRERWILWAYDGLTSAGRKDEFERRGRGAAPSQDEITELVRRGFLKQNKAGAVQITTEGKNVRTGLYREPPFVARSGGEREVTAEDLMLGTGVKPSR